MPHLGSIGESKVVNGRSMAVIAVSWLTQVDPWSPTKPCMVDRRCGGWVRLHGAPAPHHLPPSTSGVTPAGIQESRRLAGDRKYQVRLVKHM